MDQTLTEYTKQEHLIAAGASDQAIDLGGVASATIFYLENATTETMAFKINGTGNDAQALASGFVLSKGLTITSLHVTVAGAVAIPITVIVIA